VFVWTRKQFDDCELIKNQRSKNTEYNQTAASVSWCTDKHSYPNSYTVVINRTHFLADSLINLFGKIVQVNYCLLVISLESQ